MTRLQPVSIIWVKSDDWTMTMLWEYVAGNWQPADGWKFTVHGFGIVHEERRS